MHTLPDLKELQETRLGMEAKCPPGSPFRQSCERLCRRFDDDLADERDRLLSQCASLMLIKFIQEDIAGVTDCCRPWRPQFSPASRPEIQIDRLLRQVSPLLHLRCDLGGRNSGGAAVLRFPAPSFPACRESLIPLPLEARLYPSLLPPSGKHRPCGVIHDRTICSSTA